MLGLDEHATLSGEEVRETLLMCCSYLDDRTHRRDCGRFEKDALAIAASLVYARVGIDVIVSGRRHSNLCLPSHAGSIPL